MFYRPVRDALVATIADLPGSVETLWTCEVRVPYTAAWRAARQDAELRELAARRGRSVVSVWDRA